MSFPRHQFAIEAHKSSITQITCYSPEPQTKSTQHYPHSPKHHCTPLAVPKRTLLRIRVQHSFAAHLQHICSSSRKLRSASAFPNTPHFPSCPQAGKQCYQPFGTGSRTGLILNLCILSGKPPRLDAQTSSSSSAPVTSLLSTQHDTTHGNRLMFACNGTQEP